MNERHTHLPTTPFGSVLDSPRPKGYLTAIKDRRERVVRDLTREVVRKLLDEISRDGMVTVFNDRETGAVQQEMYSAYFSSLDLPHLSVVVWRKHTHEPDSTHPTFRLNMQILDLEAPNHSGLRSLNIIMRNEENRPEIRFTQQASRKNIEGNYQEEPSYRGKVTFLRQILASTVDREATRQKLEGLDGKGVGTFDDDGYNVHTRMWIADMDRNPMSELINLPASSPTATSAATRRTT